MVPFRDLIGLLGLPRLSPSRLAMAFVLLIVAIGVIILAAVNLIAALRLYLLHWLSPLMALVAVGVGLLVLAAILCLIASRLARPLPPRKRPPPPRPSTDAATVQAIAWVQQHPSQSAVLAAILGFCMGASPETRKAVIDLTKPKR